MHGLVKLYITIEVERKNGLKFQQLYYLRFLTPDKDIADPAWRLTKTNGESFDVSLLPHGAECTCPDFAWCRQNKDPKGCKHIAALRSASLLQAERFQ